MSIKPDHWIRKMALERGMIDPFVDVQTEKGAISYGVSAYGYDIRRTENSIIPPLMSPERCFRSRS